MTLYPEINSPELQPYAAPFGRLMLGYGRAVAAAIALVKTKLGSELEAAKLVNKDSDNLPKRIRKLFRGHMKGDDFRTLSTALTRMKFIAGKRHHLVHGQWWLKLDERGHLQTRNIQKNRIVHSKPFSAELLDRYASEIDQIAADFEFLEYTYASKS